MILVVLAAGLGSRYGGDKQRDALGPNGEWITDLNLLDAAAAGFRRAVLVCREEHRDAVVAHCADHAPAGLRVEGVVQEPPPTPRTRPWGTGYALIAARPLLDAPCCVINADDCYGPGTFAVAAGLLAGCRADRGGLVAFGLGACLSSAGGVSRGLCRVAGEDLQGVDEHTDCRRVGASVAARDPEGRAVALDPDAAVSLNTWCLHPAALDRMQRQFEAWLAGDPSPEAEFQLPTAIDAQLRAGDLRVRCVASPETWHGVTTRDDRTAVVEHLRQRLAADAASG